ncbi:MAG: xylulokinase [Anaerolineae bacterium]|nr:xylulokinase [Anaerolineae bacterium]
MTLLLGIDIGTSSAKAVLFDPVANRIIVTAGQEYPIHHPTPDRAEQNPEDWWQAVVAAVRRVTSGRDVTRIAGIGFSGQMHGVTLLDSAGHPLHPSIIWADQRSAPQVTELTNLLGAESYARIAGTLPAAGFMGPTLLWLKQHDPALLERAHQVILPKDYVRLKMTGEIASDVSDAAATGLFDITQRDWSSAIIRHAGLPEHIFPAIKSSLAVAGYVQAAAAAELGIPAGTMVVTGCADQPAQAVGNGLIRPGLASVTTGSGGQVFIPIARTPGQDLPTDPRLHVFNHAAPDLWYILGAILSAGLSLRWLRDLTGLASVPDAYSILSAEAAAVPAGAGGLIFLPYLTGERTPHMDALARGAFIGLSAHHTRGHIARAVMEGVSFALRQTLEISRGLGASASTIIAAGGAAESDVWRSIQADVFGLPLQRTRLKEQAGVGASLLAGVGAGVYRDLDDACARTVQSGPITEPDPQRHARYDALYHHFLELYPRLKGDFARLSANST